MKYRAHIQPSTYESVQVGENIELNVNLANRFFKILRLKEGEEVGLFDGCGRQIDGKLSHPKEKSLCISTIQKKEEGPLLGLAQAWVSMDKAEQIVQRCTEIGATKILFFLSERGETKLKGDPVKKMERLRRIAEDAARQSGRFWVPEIFGPLRFDEALAIADPGAVASWMGVTSIGHPLVSGDLDSRLYGSDRDSGTFIWIGPEGGLSPSEIKRLGDSGVQAACFNPNILRTETAGMVALSILQGHSLSTAHSSSGN